MTYQYPVYRRAIAEKLSELKDYEIVTDISDWSIYKNKGNKYALIKFANEGKDGCKIKFNGNKILSSDNDKIKSIFWSLFKNKNDEEGKELSFGDTENIKYTFYLAMLDDNKNIKFKIIKFESTDDIKRINTTFGNGDYFFYIKQIKDSKKHEVGLRPNPESYENLKFETSLLTLDEKILEEINIDYKVKEQYKVDYNRILDRSFIYFVEYGTCEELENILQDKEIENFQDFQKHLESNQKILENNKNEKNTWEPIVRYKDIDKTKYKIDKLKKYFKAYFEKLLPLEEKGFKEKFFNNNEERKCAYCGVPEGQLHLLNTVRAGRGKRLEYDRILSRDGGNKIEYKLENIVLSCYWCNNAKTDTFSPKDFKDIARGINIVWNKKLKESGKNETICFSENNVLWSL